MMSESSSKASAEASTETDEPKKCWICLQDESDDTPESSRWRLPCACHLQAHESCLLDWVAEIERGSVGSGSKSKVECPQCKTQIRVIRPRSLYLEALQYVQWAKRVAIIPVTVMGLASGLLLCCYAHGVGSVYLVFGPQEAGQIVGFDPNARAYGLINRTNILLPFVPVGLLFSRTSYFKPTLPFLPLVFLLGHNTATSLGDWWPPSTTMTLLSLPYIERAYHLAYKFAFAEREKAWLRELRPRGADENPQGQQNDQPEHNHGAGGVGIELGIEVEVEEEVVEPEEQQQAVPPAGVQPQPEQIPNIQAPEAQPNQQAAPGQGEAGLEAPLAAQLVPPPQQNANQNGNGVANALPILISVVLEKAVGTILFPGIAAGMGLALKWVLPSRWTKADELFPPSALQKFLGLSTTSHKGFLQTHFGRSIAGGLLYVFLRDSFGLYTTYRMATIQRQRSIANYEGKRAGSAASNTT